MPRPIACVRAAFVFLLLVLPSPATAGGWAPFGPAGSPLTGFVVQADGRLVVSSSANGVFASADGGHSWFLSSAGMNEAQVQALAAGADGILYASSPTAFFASTDGGKSWTTRSQPLPLGAPAVPGGDLLEVASNSTGGLEIFLARDNVLLRSTDGGVTWQTALTGPLPVSALLVDPTDARSVFAAMPTVGLYHSGDGGTTWALVTRVEPSMPPPFDKPFSMGVGLLAAAPTSPATLFAEMNRDLYRSTDGGVSWHQLPPAPKPSVGYVYAVAVSPGSPATVYTLQQVAEGFGDLAIFASRNLGRTWKRVDKDPGGPPLGDHLVVDRATGDLFLQSWLGLARGTEGGAHWTRLQSFNCGVNAGLPGGVPDLVRWTGDGSRIYAAVGGALSVSRDGGRSWIGRPQAPGCIGDLSVDPLFPDILYAGAAGGVYRSWDGGATWKKVLKPEDPLGDLFDIAAIAVPQSGKIVAGGCGIWMSSDGGKRWTRTLGCDVVRFGHDYLRTISRLIVDPLDPDILYADDLEAFTDQQPPDYRTFTLRSVDGGRRWHYLKETGALAVDPQTPHAVYLLTAGRIRKSTDDGRTWQTISEPGPSVATDALVVSPVDPQILYASGDQGVFRSVDGGITWQPFGTGLAGRLPGSLFADPRGHSLITEAGGLFRLRF